MSKGRWLAIDGEGVGRGPHRYVLLADSDGDHISDVNGLTTRAVLQWLLDRPKGVRIAGYYLGYDISKWLADLPNSKLYKLLRPELRVLPGGGFSWIRWRGYRLHYLQRALYIGCGKRTVTVWDHGPFHQCSFVKACKRAGVGHELELIERMKSQRGTAQWKEQSIDDLLEYCVAECKLMVKLADRLEASLHTIEVDLSTWHGPGSVASAVLREHRIHERRGDPPHAVESAADSAYYGGRFEHACIGERAGVWAYDITSAYPAQTAKLPCLEHGQWRRVKTERQLERPDVATACVRTRVRDIGDAVWGPLPCRLADGSVVFPRGGFTGWYWLDEYNLARNFWRGVEWGGEAWVLKRRCDCQPFDWITDLFARRFEAEELEAGAIKLLLNSNYGKLAQRIGNPKYASRIWAGLVTSGTRAQLLRMLLAHDDPANVFAVATDGLYSGEHHNTSPGKVLGDWEAEYHGRVWFVRPGVYWGEDGLIRARGLGRRQLEGARETIAAAIERGQTRVDLGHSTGFAGARESIYRTRNGELKRSPRYGEWIDMPCRLSLDPRPKRDVDWMPPELGGVESRPYSAGMSTGQLMKLVERLQELMR